MSEYIARKGNVEYNITRQEIGRFLANGATIFEVDEKGYRVYKAPAGKEDLQNKVAELNSIIADLKKQIALKDNQIISLTSDNTELKKENQKIKAAQAVAAAEAETTAKKGRGKKAEE